MFLPKENSNWFIYERMPVNLPVKLYIWTGILLKVLSTMIPAETIAKTDISYD